MLELHPLLETEYCADKHGFKWVSTPISYRMQHVINSDSYLYRVIRQGHDQNSRYIVQGEPQMLYGEYSTNIQVYMKYVLG